eukprot:4523722-Pleurochrysis_carterae.AAC.1
MHSLYHPHRESSGEPSERVTPKPDTLLQLRAHELLVASSGGALFSAALRPEYVNESASAPKQIVS